ncbi:hypothetical protein FA15DRAFT_588079 [Coprinopsis marcescibilis]|uniref:Cora-domain-containing protein n=1 Tax=Coprinopsis marcescibilis TaxID=230819 RepID=A0A5C3L365_COPMA|nr:hypothetical protein FA15DRAFT_588079 [Coprinopsis marcescibilis]
MAQHLSVSRNPSAHSSRRSIASRKSWQSDPSRIAPPSHRHAAPSAPWPWVDIGDDVDQDQLQNDAPPIPEKCAHVDCECWKGYPQSRFPNWTERQVRKSKIWDAIHDYKADLECIIYRCDVDTKGIFRDPGLLEAPAGQEGHVWNTVIDGLGKRPENLRVRTLFVQNMSGPVLQMLGARFNIEPFFFSSSLNWIPSRFQEEIEPNVGDHITITLPFIKSMPEDEFTIKQMPLFPSSTSIASKKGTLLGSQKIDTQAPLVLYSNQRILALDLISIHLIRNINGSTIISYHPTLNLPTTTASYMHERIRFAGQSVYWQSMFQRSPDPTLVLMCFVWHALYAWDESLESLYQHILALENRVIETAHMPLTRELHVIRAHHLHYKSLLDNFIRNIEFIEATKNPFMTEANFSEADIAENNRLITRECKTMRQDVERIKLELQMQERRLKNVMNLVFSSVNITDSKYMREMTEAAVRDSAAMKQIAYLTMIFLPASFIATVFGMNVSEINPEGLTTVPIYLAVALPLTIFTAWVIVAFQSKYIFPGQVPFWRRLAWPFFLLYNYWFKKPDHRIGIEDDEEAFELDQNPVGGEYKIDIVGGSQDGDNHSRIHDD